MINRLLRVNVLLQREISDILHRHYQQDTVTLTITEVRCAPDLRTARVFVSVVGDEDHAAERMRWLSRQAKDIRLELGRRIVLKYLPRLDYVLDGSAERGTRIVQILDELDAHQPREAAAARDDEADFSAIDADEQGRELAE
ncbi:30S ribosome-binding factor RbfA [Cephaloticoccus capnophilus]|uniref:30S ribosome-binding factor RbfA n=1 Tax=Cephaloticoccus capnophilus TaxID=1548208 RepID=UPI000838F75A|nr:30S ribosome-binding factor RbfA [Cephaloticoccus capnophilus]